MYDKELVLEIMKQIYQAAETILQRFEPVKKVCDFTDSPAGMEKLDSICMRDIISHHYFQTDADVIFDVCTKHIRKKNGDRPRFPSILATLFVSVACQLHQVLLDAPALGQFHLENDHLPMRNCHWWLFGCYRLYPAPIENEIIPGRLFVFHYLLFPKVSKWNDDLKFHSFPLVHLRGNWTNDIPLDAQLFWHGLG